MKYKVLFSLRNNDGIYDTEKLSKFLYGKVFNYCLKYKKTRVYSIFLENIESVGGKAPYAYMDFIFKEKEKLVLLKDGLSNFTLSRLKDVKVLYDKNGNLYLCYYINDNNYYIYNMFILSESNYPKVNGKGLGYNDGAIRKLPHLKFESKNKVVLDFDFVYKGGSGLIYEQHNLDVSILEYSFNEGKSWEPVPVDLGKIDYMKCWYRLKYI